METNKIPTISDIINTVSENCNPTMVVTLSSHQWTQLLQEMQDHMCICNHDQNVNKRLFEAITSQLTGLKVNIVEKVNHAPESDEKSIAKMTPWYQFGFFRGK